MINKFCLGCLLLLFCGFSFVSCIGSNNSGASVDVSEKVVVSDYNGEQVEVPKNPKVVATFDYGILDILENMGIEISGLPKGSLPSRFLKYSDSKYVDLGGLKNPDFEEISALNPDLIIISGRQADMKEKFSEIAPTLYLAIDQTNYIEGLKNNIDTLLTIFDSSQDIKNTYLRRIEEGVRMVSDFVKANDLNVLTIMVNEGNLSTFGLGSRYAFIYNELGFKPVDENIEAVGHGQQISFEYIVDKNPDYIFVIDRSSAIGNQGTAQTVLDNELLKSTDAYINDRILYLDSQVWYTVSGGVSSTEDMINEIWNFINR